MNKSKNQTEELEVETGNNSIVDSGQCGGLCYPNIANNLKTVNKKKKAIIGGKRWKRMFSQITTEMRTTLRSKGYHETT